MKHTVKKGFTLVELLVVISIIAMLLAILMPSLQKARAQAQKVICSSNQKQWGTMFQLYASENNGRFHEGWQSYKLASSIPMGKSSDYPQEDKLWLNAYRAYYGDKEAVRTCASARKIQPNPNNANKVNIASSKLAYQLTSNYYGGRDNTEGVQGSFGLNGFICSKELKSDGTEYDNERNGIWENRYWKTADSPNPYNIPMLSDSSYWKIYPLKTNNPKQVVEDDFIWKNPSYTQVNYMASAAIDRHNGRVNVTFMDFSVRPVGLIDLWGLKWSKQYKNPLDLNIRSFEPSDWLKRVSR